MANFESGVASYVEATTTIKVYFPIDFKGRKEIACKHCPYLSSNERICQLNKQPVAYPMTMVGDWCPLEEVQTNE